MVLGNSPRRGVLDVCVGLFVAAALLYLAVQLVLSVLVPLVVIAGVALVGALLVRFIMWHRQGW